MTKELEITKQEVMALEVVIDMVEIAYTSDKTIPDAKELLRKLKEYVK